MLVREADAGGGLGFTAVRLGNRFKALAVRQLAADLSLPHDARSGGALRALGFDVEAHATDEGTPFGNVLFVLTRSQRAASA